MYTYGQTMRQLCFQFSVWLDRAVIDRTAIAGAFDIHFDFSPKDVMSGGPDAPPAADPFGAISAAVLKAGLKLESARGPGQFLVVDHVERPGEN